MTSILLPLLLLSDPLLLGYAQLDTKKILLLGGVALAGGFIINGFLLHRILAYGYDSYILAKLNRGISYAIMILWPLFASWRR